MNIVLLDIRKIQEKIVPFKNNNWYIKKLLSIMSMVPQFIY